MQTIEDILELIENDSVMVPRITYSDSNESPNKPFSNSVVEKVSEVVDFVFNSNYNSYAIVNRDSRKYEHKYPRFISFKILRDFSNLSLTSIASEFGKTHATVINGISKLETDIKSSNFLRDKIAVCYEMLSDTNVYNRIFNKTSLLLSEVKYNKGEVLIIRDYLFSPQKITSSLKLKQVVTKLISIYGDGELVKSESGIYELSNDKYSKEYSLFKEHSLTHLK